MHRLLKAFTKKEKKMTRMFRQSILSYTIVLLLPLLIFTFYCTSSYSALKERTYESQHLILENTAEQINSILQDLNRLNSHLQLNQYVTALSTPNSSPYFSMTMNSYYLKNNLVPLQVSNSFIQEINLYFTEFDYIVNTSSTYDRDLLRYMEPNSNTLSLQEWDRILESLSANTWVCVSENGKNFLAFATPLLTDGNGQPLSVMCVQIDRKYLQNILESRLPTNYPCDFALISGETVLVSTDGSYLPSDTFSIGEVKEYFCKNSASKIYTIDHDTVADYYPLQIPEMALLFFADKRGFHSQMYHTLEIMLLSLVVCGLLGLIVIMYISHKNYKPMSQILHFIHGTGTEITPESNEYGLIMKMLVENRNEIQKQQELLKNNYLQKILTGEIAFSEISDSMAKSFSLDSFCASLCVVQLSVDDAEAKDISDLNYFIIRNVYQEILSETFPDSYFSRQKQYISVLVSLPSSQECILTKLEQLTEQMIHFLSKSFRLCLKAGISRIQDRGCIPDAYLQANTALRYQILFETGEICLYDSIPQKQIISSISLNTSDYVVNLVTQGLQTQLRQYFNTLTRELKENALSWKDARSCYYFFYQVTARLQYYCQAQYGFSLEALSFLKEDYFAQPLPKALSLTCDAYLAACDEISQRKLSSVQWGKNICRYIENNYFDANLNLNSISAHFQISSSYLSKRFREQYQKSVIDYLYEVRIANSLSLLTDTDLKIADIAEMTGFIDSNAFIRIFKKMKGITPGKYSQAAKQME